MSQIQSILSANAFFYRAFESRDLVGMGEVWSKGSATLCIHPGRNVLVGWEAIALSWEQIFQNTPDLAIRTEIKATEIAGDLAYVVVVETVMQVARGRKMEARSLATNIFERMAGRWLLIHHHASPILS